MKKHIEDFGRKIHGAKKEMYQLKNDQFKVYLSKLWPKKSINKMSQDRFCRYLITCLRDNLVSIIETDDENRAKAYINGVTLIKDSLRDIEESDEFFNFIRQIEYHDVVDKDLIIKGGKIGNYAHMNQESMEEAHFEYSDQEIAREETLKRVWKLHALDVVYDSERNQIFYEIPYVDERVYMELSDLEWTEQDIEGDCLVELVETDNEWRRVVTRLNVDEDDYQKKYQEIFQDQMKRLNRKRQRRANRRIRTDFQQNPGICSKKFFYGPVTENEILNTFNISGEFGNYLSQEQRRKILPKLANALFTLCVAIGFKPTNISIPLLLQKNRGEEISLGVALAARGSGRASAHYEPKEHVVNLTKANLVLGEGGCFAHEWGHALDRYLYQIFFHDEGFLSCTTLEQLEILPEFRDIVQLLLNSKSKFVQDSQSLDNYENRKKPYWNSCQEKFARVFSSVIIQILDEKNITNNFLAFNYNDEISYGNKIISANPKGEELKTFVKAFKKLFLKLIDMEFFRELNEEDDLVIKRKFPVSQSREEDQPSFKFGKQIAFF